MKTNPSPSAPLVPLVAPSGVTGTTLPAIDGDSAYYAKVGHLWTIYSPLTHGKRQVLGEYTHEDHCKNAFEAMFPSISEKVAKNEYIITGWVNGKVIVEYHFASSHEGAEDIIKLAHPSIEDVCISERAKPSPAEPVKVPDSPVKDTPATRIFELSNDVPNGPFAIGFIRATSEEHAKTSSQYAKCYRPCLKEVSEESVANYEKHNGPARWLDVAECDPAVDDASCPSCGVVLAEFQTSCDACGSAPAYSYPPITHPSGGKWKPVISPCPSDEGLISTLQQWKRGLESQIQGLLPEAPDVRKTLPKIITLESVIDYMEACDSENEELARILKSYGATEGEMLTAFLERLSASHAAKDAKIREADEILKRCAMWLGKMIADGGHMQCVAPNDCVRTLERVEAFRAALALPCAPLGS